MPGATSKLFSPAFLLEMVSFPFSKDTKRPCATAPLSFLDFSFASDRPTNINIATTAHNRKRTIMISSTNEVDLATIRPARRAIVKGIAQHNNTERHHRV